MAFKKKPELSKPSTSGYMTTYSDMVTLLMCFFVLLYSMSNVDVAKFTALAESYAGRPVVIQGELEQSPETTSLATTVENAEPEATGEPEGTGSLDITEADAEAARKAREMAEQINRMASNFTKYLAQNDTSKKIVVEALGIYLLITFPDGLLFDSGKAVIRPDAIEALDMVADKLWEYSGHMISVEGHTDNVPQNTLLYPSNRHLSSARADTVVEYLVNERGFDPLNLSAEGKGEHWPIGDNNTAEGRAQNRRVEIKVYAEQVNMNSVEDAANAE